MYDSATVRGAREAIASRARAIRGQAEALDAIGTREITAAVGELRMAGARLLARLDRLADEAAGVLRGLVGAIQGDTTALADDADGVETPLMPAPMGAMAADPAEAPTREAAAPCVRCGGAGVVGFGGRDEPCMHCDGPAAKCPVGNPDPAPPITPPPAPEEAVDLGNPVGVRPEVLAALAGMPPEGTVYGGPAGKNGRRRKKGEG